MFWPACVFKLARLYQATSNFPSLMEFLNFLVEINKFAALSTGGCIPIIAMQINILCMSQNHTNVNIKTAVMINMKLLNWRNGNEGKARAANIFNNDMCFIPKRWIRSTRLLLSWMIQCMHVTALHSLFYRVEFGWVAEGDVQMLDLTSSPLYTNEFHDGFLGRNVSCHIQNTRICQ